MDIGNRVDMSYLNPTEILAKKFGLGSNLLHQDMDSDRQESPQRITDFSEY